MDSTNPSRRAVLRTAGLAGGLLLAGCSGGDGGDSGSSGGTSGTGDTDGTDGGNSGDGGGSGSGESDGGSSGSGGDSGGSDGGTDGDSGGSDGSDGGSDPDTCDDSYLAEPTCAAMGTATDHLVGFEASGTGSLVTFDYPCGFATSPDSEFSEEFFMLNVTATFGDSNSSDNVYLDVQIRQYYEPVSDGFMEEKLSNDKAHPVDFEYAGETRTASLVEPFSSTASPYGNAVVPHPETGDLIRLEFIGTLDGGECAEQARAVVKATMQSLAPNEGTSFSPKTQ